MLNDSNETVSIWTEISRRKKKEIFQKRICSIIGDFLIYDDIMEFVEKKDEVEKDKEEKKISKKLFLSDLDYFDDIIDENKLILMEDVRIRKLSNNSINVLIWREIGNYSNNTINKILYNIEKYQKNERRNVHLLLLISESKISSGFIRDLSNSLDYTIVNEILLSQFDVTKYAFLEEIRKKYEGKYNREKFNKAISKLLNPFRDIVEKSNERIKNKGLAVNLQKYPGNIRNVTQLLKYILYDFQNDFSNFKGMKLKKPFEDINPIGLNPNYSSSIDDWSQEKLKKQIKEYLEPNGFVNIHKGKLEIKIPRIEEKIYKIIEEFSREKNAFTTDELKVFVFDKSDNHRKIKKVFLKDLENRGLIVYKNKKWKILEIKQKKLKNIFKSINNKVRRLVEYNQNRFYHIYTFKKYDYSLIFMEDFLDNLKILQEIDNTYSKSKYRDKTKKILFLKISMIFFTLSSMFISATPQYLYAKPAAFFN